MWNRRIGHLCRGGQNDPTKLTFIEMYADEDAYQVHRDTPHFQKYFHTTKNMIAERVLLEAVPVELRDKHNTARRRLAAPAPSPPYREGSQMDGMGSSVDTMAMRHSTFPMKRVSNWLCSRKGFIL